MKIYTLLQTENMKSQSRVCGSFSSGNLATEHVIQNFKPVCFGLTFEIIESDLDSGETVHWDYVHI